MKNIDTLKAFKFLTGPESNNLVFTIKANVIIQKNIKILKEEVHTMSIVENKTLQPSKRYSEFTEKQKEIKKEHDIATTDEVRCDAISKSNNLISEYYDDIQEHEKKLSEWRAFLEEESDLELLKIKPEDIKNESMSKFSFECLSLMLDSDSD
jgi:hypothetical protein